MKYLSNPWHSLVCGCHREKHKTLWVGWVRWLFPLLTAMSVAWFLFRVIPKPIRATYPCQQAAFPLLSSFVIWLLGIKAGLIAWFQRKGGLKRLRPALFVAGLLVFLATIAWATITITGTGVPGREGPNVPMGIAKGIFPGRVTWVRDTNAVPWSGTGSWWADNTGINQAVVDRMLSLSLRGLTGATSDADAWAKVFKFYNSNHGRGNTGYSATEKIAIKINLNNCTVQTDTDNNADASKQTILALLRQLVNRAGIPQANITVYDAIRAIPDRIYTSCHSEFPGVVWVDDVGANGRTLNTWVNNGFSYSVANAGATQIPACVYQATYLINLPLLKGHEFAGVTLAGKNHYGSLSARDHSNYLNVWKTTMPQYSMLVDLMGAPQLGGKTILYFMDGLLANYTNTQDNNHDRCGFTNLFNGQWCASIMTSFDPVAFDSVGLDFLYSEFGPVLGRRNRTDTGTMVNNCDNYLHEASQADAPPSGVFYKPDGVNRLASLGVHEHWNNSTNKQYSRNLSTNGIGIELLVLTNTSSAMSVTMVAPMNAAWFLPGTNVLLQASVTTNLSQLDHVAFYGNSTWLGVSSNTSPSLTWSNAPQGQWAVYAVAYDSDNYAYTSSVVNVTIAYNQISIAITNPLAGAVFVQGTNILLQASASASAAPLREVDFYYGGTIIGASSNAPYSTQWTNIPTGTWSLTAVATDTGNYSVTSAVVNVTVQSGATFVMNASDAITTSSFNSGLNWTGGAAPVAGNSYQTAAFMLRTPQNTTPLAFAGSSLEIQAGGTLRDKTAATITISNLIVDNTGTIELTQPNGVNSAADVGTLAGGITLNGIATIHAGLSGDIAGETFTICSAIGGTGGFTTAGSTGNIVLTGTNTYTGATTVSAGTLTVNPTGAINAGNVAGLGEIIVGNVAGVNAVMNIAGGTVIATSGVNPAFTSGALSGANGFVTMTSGTLTTANGTASEVHVGETAGGYGAFDLSGGTVTLSGYFVVGANGGGNGVFNMSGGSVTANGELLTIANLNGGTGVVNMSGGTFSSQTAAVGGIRLCESAGARATLNVSGSAALSLGPDGLDIGYQTGACVAIANLLGGTVTTSQVHSHGAASGATAILNFNGGTLKAGNTPLTAFMTGLSAAYIYGGGAVIDDGGNAITVAQPLLPPTGNGVRSISVTAGGIGHLDTPIVTITRGAGDTTGTNASAVAQVSSGGVVTNIVIVNPGTGYTAAPTVTLFGGGYTSAATIGTVSIAANTASGGLTKQGSGTLTLSGVNTYGGPTIISAGTLALTGTGSIAGTPLISIASGATFDVSGKSGGLVLGGSQTLSNNAAATGRIAGNITNNTGVISVTYTNGTPALTVTNGTLALASGSTFKINNTGPALQAGSYLIIATNAVGFVAGTAPSSVTVGGTGTAGNNSLSISNSQLYLVVTAVSTNAYLTSLALHPAGLTSAFASNTFCYAATNAYGSTPTVTVGNADLTATNKLIYNGNPIGVLASGVASSPLALNLNPAVTNVVQVRVTAQDGVTMNTYTVNLTQWPSVATKPSLTNSVSVSGGVLTLNWPLANMGYRLLVQTNHLDSGVSGNPNDWAELPGSAATNTASILTTNLNEYYRLVYP